MLPVTLPSLATTVDRSVRRAAPPQLAHLGTDAPVRERVERGGGRLHAWYCDLGRAELFEHDPAHGDFVRLGEVHRAAPDAPDDAAAAAE